MKSMGFIGSGRAAKIILGGLKHTRKLDFAVTVSDPSQDAINALIREIPGVRSAGDDNKASAGCDYVFISLHPPVFIDELKKVSGAVKDDAIIISLAPRIKIETIKEVTGAKNIIRMLPNSPSIIGKGYNPVVFSKDFDPSRRKEAVSLLEKLGDLAEVKEESLEIYAVITAMGPTYFLFQWKEMLDLAIEFGLSEKDAMEGVSKMLSGTLSLFSDTGIDFAVKNDLVPVRPFSDEEDNIKNIFKTRLSMTFNKLRS